MRGVDEVKYAASLLSVNQGVGTVDQSWVLTGTHAGIPNRQSNGPWLNGSHSHIANQPYATFGKSTHFTIIGPSEVWVFADDDPWTINDAGIAVIAQRGSQRSRLHASRGAVGASGRHDSLLRGPDRDGLRYSLTWEGRRRSRAPRS